MDRPKTVPKNAAVPPIALIIGPQTAQFELVANIDVCCNDIALPGTIVSSAPRTLHFGRTFGVSSGTFASSIEHPFECRKAAESAVIEEPVTPFTQSMDDELKG
jgi:hypothetical protein